MDFITARLEQHPSAFVYHYGNYEESALKRLAMIHARALDGTRRKASPSGHRIKIKYRY